MDGFVLKWSLTKMGTFLPLPNAKENQIDGGCLGGTSCLKELQNPEGYSESSTVAKATGRYRFGETQQLTILPGELILYTIR